MKVRTMRIPEDIEKGIEYVAKVWLWQSKIDPVLGVMATEK